MHHEEPTNGEYMCLPVIVECIYTRLVVFDYENLTASFDTRVVLEIADHQGGPSLANLIPLSVGIFLV